MKEIYWKSKDFQKRKKGVNWYWVFWAIILFFVFVFYYLLEDEILAFLILILAILINLSHFKEPKIRKYSFDDENFYLDDKNKIIPFEEIEGFNIDYNNLKILLKLNKKYSLIQIPFEENQNMEKIEEILVKKIKKDENLKIPFLEVFLSRLFGF